MKVAEAQKLLESDEAFVFFLTGPKESYVFALTTTGYGDIHPLHPLARSLCNLEAIFGQLYPATLLARLVTLEIAHRSEP